MSDDLAETVDELLARVEALVESLEGTAAPEEAVETVEDLLDVADEVEDLLETVDVSELVDAVGAEDVSEVVDLEDVPEAIEEQSPRKALELRKLLQLADLRALFDSADMRQVRREKRDLEAELEDLLEDEGAADGEESLLEGGGTGPIGGDSGGSTSVGGSGGAAAGEDLGGAAVDQELLEQSVQSKVDDAVVAFRQGLLEAHEKFRRLREANQERTGSMDDQPTSRNPTAYSSMTSSKGDVGRGITHSTVPRETRHSSAPNRKRIYGDRFEEETDG